MEFPMFSWWNPNVFDGKHTFWCLSSPFFPIQSPCLVATHIFWGSNHYSYHQILAKTVIFSSGKTTTFHPKTTIFCGEDLPRSMGRRAPGLRSLPSGRGRRPLWRSTLQTTAVQGQGCARRSWWIWMGTINQSTLQVSCGFHHWSSSWFIPVVKYNWGYMPSITWF